MMEIPKCSWSNMGTLKRRIGKQTFSCCYYFDHLVFNVNKSQSYNLFCPKIYGSERLTLFSVLNDVVFK